MRIAVFGGSKHTAGAEPDAEAFAEFCRRLGQAEAAMPYEGLGPPQGRALSGLVYESCVDSPAELTASIPSLVGSIRCGWW